MTDLLRYRLKRGRGPRGYEVWHEVDPAAHMLGTIKKIPGGIWGFEAVAGAVISSSYLREIADFLTRLEDA